MQRRFPPSENLLGAKIEIGCVVRLQIRIADKNNSAYRNARVRWRHDKFRQLRGLKRCADRGAYGRTTRRRPDEARARVETISEGTKITLIESQRIVGLTRRIGGITQDGRTLSLR